MRSGNSAPVSPRGECVIYWMQRAQRARSNAALSHAIHRANELRKPVVVVFGLTPDYPGATLRHYFFMLPGLQEAATTLRTRGIAFIARFGSPPEALLRLVQELRPCLVVSDENPVRIGQQWRERVAAELPVRFERVDADVVVPSAHFPKEEWSAATLRRKIAPLISEYLVEENEPEPLVRWSAPEPEGLDLDRWREWIDELPLDRSVGPSPRIPGGREAGLRTLGRFVAERLRSYSVQRNHPEVDGTSRLSPYLHFGQVSPLEAALAVQREGGEDARVFLEELIVRRELAINFVLRNPRYDSLGCGPEWALKTLAKHAGDPRQAYTLEELEGADTHDPLWNAAQRQMVETGFMPNYLRMLWGKKILEWSPTPADAYHWACHLNDKYFLCGRDPNGYAGVAWCIVGKHDRAWGPERPMFGTVRYMSSEACRRKFDVPAYLRQWGEGEPHRTPRTGAGGRSDRPGRWARR